MGSQGNCVLDDSSYSSSVPVIGLYIMGATLVCLSFILVDVYAGFRNRKRWLPCRFFSLNSITLTLLSIVAKLPVDLTSPMPRVQDQLSKLTGTALICISMGFFMPSIGTYTESEFDGPDILRDGVEDAETIIAYKPIVQTGSMFYLIFYAKTVGRYVFKLISSIPTVMCIPFEIWIEDFFEDCCDPPDDVREEAMKEFKELIDDEEENGLDEWTLKKGFNDMERGIEKAKASDQLIKILSKVSLPTQDESLVPQLKAHYNSKRPGSLDEVFEILDFVDKKMSSSSFENKKKSMLAKAMWKGGDFRILLAKIARYHVPDSFLYPRS
ncbi:hypothetical protein Sjap_009281 [Stephania japonica]|uniref:Uncharacterized protein n=1 Tax=Stephania japonica TaxID=461633 RepID=A0AAP0JR67_9MAGN